VISFGFVDFLLFSNTSETSELKRRVVPSGFGRETQQNCKREKSRPFGCAQDKPALRMAGAFAGFQQSQFFLLTGD